MKKTVVLLLIAALAAVSCSPKKVEGTKLVQGTPAYQLAKDLAAIVPEFDPDKNAVLVTAKGFTVTVGDVVEVIQGTMGNGTAQLKSMPAAQLKPALGRAAVQVGERTLLLAAAAKAKVAVTPEELKKAMDDQYAGSGGETQFLEALKTNGVSLDFVKKTIGDDRLIQKYFETQVFASIKVADEDLKKAYAEDKTATVRHILLLTQDKKDAEKAEIRKKMEGILARAKKGEDFAALATELTEDAGSKQTGGLYEDFPRGKMVKAFEDAAFTVPVGQISDVVETNYGFHIIKVENRKKETAPFEEVKAQLTESLKNRMQAAAYDKLITDLKAAAKFTEVKK
ncbi:MAG: peptidylprolyl isomerase [Candidatus Aminicenantes bacterium]|nr:peptidylprolyl isomerase [Candidatus Aminicenantes bacterium]